MVPRDQRNGRIGSRNDVPTSADARHGGVGQMVIRVSRLQFTPTPTIEILLLLSASISNVANK